MYSLIFFTLLFIVIFILIFFATRDVIKRHSVIEKCKSKYHLSDLKDPIQPRSNVIKRDLNGIINEDEYVYDKNWNVSGDIPDFSTYSEKQDSNPIFNNFVKCDIKKGCKNILSNKNNGQDKSTSSSSSSSSGGGGGGGIDGSASSTDDGNTEELCIHLQYEYKLKNGNVLEPNTPGSDEGYCFFTKKKILSKICNGKTSESILTVDEKGQTRIMCRCFWPSIITQDNIFQDCRTCKTCEGDIGSLVHKATNVPILNTPSGTDINIFDFKCSNCLEKDKEPGYNPDTGLPECIPKTFDSKINNIDDIYEDLVKIANVNPVFSTEEANVRTTNAIFLPLNSVLIDEEMAKLFTNESRKVAKVPNPCAFDHFNGSFLGGECVLTLSEKHNIAYCSPRSESVSTLVTTGDYLSNNKGRYANACYKFTTSDDNVHAYIVEYFVRDYGSESRKEKEAMASEEVEKAAAEKRKVEILKYKYLPTPIVSLQLKMKYLTSYMKNYLNLVDIRGNFKDNNKMDDDILITQAPIPDDAVSLPVPLDQVSMSEFILEYNDYGTILPAKCFMDIKCSSPIQSIYIPKCADVGNDTRSPSEANLLLLVNSKFTFDDLMFNSVVSCKYPEYDKRLNIVPQFQVKNVDHYLTTAILRFDKKTKTVHPHWPKRFIYEKTDNLRNSYLSKLKSTPSSLILQ